ncbi:5-methyltetrahydropteroyltriglutamate--homocysteine S-methyltransferase [Roseiarcaceae bacterium H3SJ34-1]|uniref:5-methyltetrahydropteroyltriglutamate-- homocysteine S-methyltransferase n=1 Tax=Terripilifer ovatus TaxID=3032367 RepID=UPI003AB97952|nr:5-methyltetrahydropteroyltriglutamate--homocysteine S-methyltransferase [Roseiarcaceae bacterium H3SJ34-1]
MTETMRVHRADHIGSLVRPLSLLEARRAHAAGTLDAKALRAVEDEAIRDVVRLQESTGIEVITDGEFRRGTYSDSFTVGGINGVRIELTEDAGWSTSQSHGHRTARRIPRVVGKVSWKGPQNREDFAFLKSLTSRTCKITLPGPAYIHYRSGRANIDKTAYPDLDTFWSDLVEAYHQEMRSLAEAGCTYLQLDETSLVKLGDERVRALLKERGDDWRDLLRVYIDVLNRVIAGAPAGMKVGVHICRSQDPNWQSDVGYDPIAPELFNDLKADLYLLEYDNPRAGTFAPLRHVPKGKTVVLGVVAARTLEIEAADAVKRRIEEAAQYISLDQLALSPHCGFGSGAEGKRGITPEIEYAKLRLCVDVAREIWG